MHAWVCVCMYVNVHAETWLRGTGLPDYDPTEFFFVYVYIHKNTLIKKKKVFVSMHRKKKRKKKRRRSWRRMQLKECATTSMKCMMTTLTGWKLSR